MWSSARATQGEVAVKGRQSGTEFGAVCTEHLLWHCPTLCPFPLSARQDPASEITSWEECVLGTLAPLRTQVPGLHLTRGPAQVTRTENAKFLEASWEVAGLPAAPCHSALGTVKGAHKGVGTLESGAAGVHVCAVSKQPVGSDSVQDWGAAD